MPDRCPPPQANALPALRSSDVLTTGAVNVVRLYRAQGSHALQWNEFRHVGPLAAMRFDHHPRPLRHHPSRGVMYAAAGRPLSTCDPLDTAVLEVFSDTGVVPVSAGRHWLAVWRPARRLRLLDLSASTWLARAGGNAALTSGPRAVARRWAAAIWNTYDDVDGLVWHSAAMPAGRSIVLFERTADALPTHPLVHVPLNHPGLRPALARIANDYRLLVV